jgi:heptosyltransferase-1
MSREPDRKQLLRKPPEKILIIKPSSLGDVVHSLPFLNSIRSCFPKAEIHWVIARGLEGLLEGNPMIDRLIVIDKDRWKKISRAASTLRELRRLFREVGGGRYDLAVDLQGLLRSGIIAMASRAAVRIGFSEAREGSRLFYNWRVRGGKDVHAVDRYMKVAGALGCETENPIFPFPLTAMAAQKGKEISQKFGDYIVLVPGARWDTKIWPAEYFGRLASMLPLKSVIVGTVFDAAIAEKVVTASGGKAVSLAGKTDLTGLIEVMRGARLAISNDSGPMHIAAAFGVPVVAIFGPTSAERTGPYGRGHVVIKSCASCAPCFKKKCADLKCMTEIAPEFVYSRMKGLLEAGEGRPRP